MDSIGRARRVPRARVAALLPWVLSLYGGLGCQLPGPEPADVAAVSQTSAEAPDARRLLAPLAASLGLARLQGSTRVRTILTDRWQSPVDRWLRPLAAAEQRLELVLDLRERSVRARFVGGRRDAETIGIKAGLAYTLVEGAREYGPDSGVEGYLGSIQRYFELPLRLAAAGEGTVLPTAEAGALRVLEPQTLGGETFDRVRLEPSRVRGGDPVVAWIERASGRVRWAELIDSGLLGFGQRALHFVEYSEVQRALLPRVIEVVPAVGSTAVVRRLEFDALELD